MKTYREERQHHANPPHLQWRRCRLLLTALPGPGGTAFGRHQTFCCLLEEPGHKADLSFLSLQEAPSRVEGSRPSSSGSLGYGGGDKTAPPVPTIVSACRRAWKHSRSESSVVGFESQFLGKKHTTEERTQEKPTQQHRSLCQRNAFNFFSPFDKNLPIKCQRFPPSHPPKNTKFGFLKLVQVDETLSLLLLGD